MKPSSQILANIAKANDFAKVAQRFYGTTNFGARNLSGVSQNLESEFRRKFNPIAEKFKEHEALNHPLFDYLKEQSKTGFTSKQFQIYRDNFFYRTELTIPSVARFIERAALSGDSQAVVDTIRNLNDEGGYGDVEKMHSNLLAKSHNIHGMRVFNLNPIFPISDSAKSPNIISEAEKYRLSKQAAFEKEYPYIAGNTWAHELAADDMLDDFRKAFFAPYQGYYTPEEYKEMIEFFTAHKDDSIEGGDIEAQHERMARSAAERACKESLENIAEVERGGKEFLDTQSALWYGLLREVEKAASIGEVIETKPEFKEKKPDTSIKAINNSSITPDQTLTREQ